MKLYSNYLKTNENYEKIKVLLVLSYGLRKLLKNIVSNTGNQIAIDFIKLHKNYMSTISFIDRSRNIDMVTYTRSSRVLDAIKEKGLNVNDEGVYNIKYGWIENREIVKIGRIIKKILPMKDYNPKELEDFVNIFKAESKKDTDGLKWERVYGRDMNYWYSNKQYVKGGGTLNRSCLRKDSRNSFINFLAGNPKYCRLLVLHNNNGKLLGRALMWRLPNGRFYLDRVYTRFDEDVNLFLDAAKNHGWLYKSKQTYGGEIPIIDGKTGENKWIKMEIEDFKRKNFNGYPYMDTFQYYDVKKNIISNDASIFVKGGSVVKLNRVDGGYTSYEDDIGVDIDMLD